MENISGNLEDVTFVQLENWLNLGDFFRSDLRAKIIDSYRIFAELIQNPKLNEVFKKPAKISPVEFTTIGLLVFVHKDTKTMAQLSVAIAKMREDVRAFHEDIWMDSEQQVTMINFIKSIKMAKIPATMGVPDGVAGSNSAGLKRKRAEKQSDDEEEEQEERNDNGKRVKKRDQKSKAKKSSTTTSNAKPSGSDRMAALGDTVTQKQQQLSALPVVPRVLPKTPSSLTGLVPPNPQVHPSAGQSFSVLSSPSDLSLPNDTGMNTLPVLPSQNAMETSLMATLVRKCMEYFKQLG